MESISTLNAKLMGSIKRITPKIRFSIPKKMVKTKMIKLTQEQLDEIESRVNKSKHSYPAIDEILKELDEDIKRHKDVEEKDEFIEDRDDFNAEEEQPAVVVLSGNLEKDETNEEVKSKEKTAPDIAPKKTFLRMKDKKIILNKLKESYRLNELEDVKYKPKERSNRNIKKLIGHPHDVEAMEKHGFKVKRYDEYPDNGLNHIRPGENRIIQVKNVHPKEIMIKNLKEVHQR